MSISHRAQTFRVPALAPLLPHSTILWGPDGLPLCPGRLVPTCEHPKGQPGASEFKETDTLVPG